MSEDNQLILACYFIKWITLGAVIFYSSKKKQTIIIHLSIQLGYSLLWWYDLKYNSSGGTALVSWFFWIISIGIHWFVCLIQLGVIVWNRAKQVK